MLNRHSGAIHDHVFRELPSLLRAGDLLVANRSRVIPARLLGQLASGGALELLLIREQGESWEVMARPARKLKPGTHVELFDGVTAVVEDALPDGRRRVRFMGVEDFQGWLARAGHAPLPPYIREYPKDPERYHTVYALDPGSVAAPTAGLHFSPELLATLQRAGIEMCFVTLHVGPGTFKPVTEEDLTRVRLESEWATLPEDTAIAIETAKNEGRRVIAVGTTTVRTLEGVAGRGSHVGRWQGELDLFIRPPYDFHVIDGLVTNFHLPRSSLLMLVSAFAGPESVRAAYHHAVANRYRFYSFGDAMLIL